MPEPLRLKLTKIEGKGSQIVLIGRQETTNQRFVVLVNDFKPFFYVEDDPDVEKVLKAKKLVYEPGLPAYVHEDPTLSVLDTLRVFVNEPGSINKRRNSFDRTWEADIPYPRRFLIDTGITSGFEVKQWVEVGKGTIMADTADIVAANDVQAKDRKVLFDIETNRPEGETKYSPAMVALGAVSAITLWDNYDDRRYITLYWHPHKGIPGRKQVHNMDYYSEAQGRNITWERRLYGTEEEMLLDWVQYLKANRPDQLGAWNGHYGFVKRNMGGYDIPYLINRLNRVGIGAAQMSPLGTYSVGYGAKKGGKGLWNCTLDGIQLIDLMSCMMVKEGGFLGVVPFSNLKDVAWKYANYKMFKDPPAIECVGENHLILRPDLTWTRAGDLKPGDKVASFDEGILPRKLGRPMKGTKYHHPKGERRKFKVGTVLHNDIQQMDSFDVHLDDGSIITTTARHPWLAHSTAEKVWVQTQYLKPGQAVSKITEVHNQIDSRDACWLAGMFDGEGTLGQHKSTGEGRGLVVSVAQRPGPLLDTLEENLQHFGFSYNRQERHNYTGLGKGDCVRLVLTGGREEIFRFLMQIRPTRLSGKFSWADLGYVQVRKEVRVVKVVTVGMKAIARLTVDSETYIADGFLMHNSWWLEDTEKFLQYNFRDVDALVALENKEGYTDWLLDLQRFAGLEDANICFRSSTLVGTMELREAKQRGVCLPTGGYSEDGAEDDEVTGGMVIDPRRTGVIPVVGVIDLNKMYVAIIQSCNISYETWVPHPETSGIDPKHLAQVPTDKGIIYFRLDKKGITPAVLDKLSHLRDKYDADIKAATDVKEIERMTKRRLTIKNLVLTAYGQFLSRFNRLFRLQTGSAVTGAGRTIIGHVDNFLLELTVKIVYGDTDSAFIDMPVEEDPLSFGGWVAEQVNASFDTVAAGFNLSKHNFHVELGEVYKPFVMGQTKKRYAGMLIAKNGKMLPQPDMVVKGLEGIKSDAAPVTSEATDAVLKAILDGADNASILEYVRSFYESILAAQIPLTDIVRSVTLNFDPERDTSSSVALKGAQQGLKHGYAYSVGARVRVIKVRGTDSQWLAIPEGEDLLEGIIPDWEHHAKLTILNPMRGILEWIGLGTAVDAIRHGTQVTHQNRLK